MNNGLTILSVILLLGCSYEPMGFETIEDLKENFKSSFDSGDSRAINKMVYWDNTPTELRKLVESIIGSGAGIDHILSIDVIPLSQMDFPENTIGKEIEPTIPLSHWLILTYDGRKNGKAGPYSGEKQIGIGVINGRYLITGMRYKEPK